MKKNRVRTFCGQTPDRSLCASAQISNVDKALSQASWDRNTNHRPLSKDSDKEFLEIVLGRLFDGKTRI